MDDWPELPYDAWKDTLETVHMWTQIVGKVKLELSPFLNEWWQVAFAVTARGLTTSTIPLGSLAFQIDFDFIRHHLDIRVSDGRSGSLALGPRSVASFYAEFMAALATLGIDVRITKTPAEVEHPIPFDEDMLHASYDSEYVTRWWRALLQTDRLLQRHRTAFVGKSSPVQFWWGSFDLSETRFSGRPAPDRDWPARWMALGADQESAAAGFWPGSERVPMPAFFAYTYPEPAGYRSMAVRPESASFNTVVNEFLLPYDEVRRASDSDDAVLEFFQSTYEAGANLGGWNRSALERPDPLGRA